MPSVWVSRDVSLGEERSLSGARVASEEVCAGGAEREGPSVAGGGGATQRLRGASPAALDLGEGVGE